MNELRKLIVHIGPAKTGTTSIQDSLTRNEQHLLQQGVLYPSFLGSRGVCSAITLASATGKLANVAEESRAHTLVISSEFLWDAPPSLVETLCRVLEIPQENVTIVTTVRSHEAQYVSLLQQRVKFDYRTSRTVPFLWSSVVHDWESRFFCLYFPFRDPSDPGNLVGRFWNQVLGLRVPEMSAVLNESPSPEVSFLLQEFHRRNFFDQPRTRRKESVRYGKTLISFDERKPVDEGRIRILSDWRARIALFVEADRQFIISRCGDFDGGRKTSVVTNTSMHPPGFVGPPGIEELLLVDFAVAEKIRRQAEEFLHAEPMFQRLSL